MQVRFFFLLIIGILLASCTPETYTPIPRNKSVVGVVNIKEQSLSFVDYNTKKTMATWKVKNPVSKSTEQIQSVISFVKDIAMQSNLLGLNAAIEASRAGEHGRGFAIVAEEVRKMEEKSKTSAEDISEQLNHITSPVLEMVHMLEEVVEKINNSTEAIDELQQV